MSFDEVSFRISAFQQLHGHTPDLILLGPKEYVAFRKEAQAIAKIPTKKKVEIGVFQGIQIRVMDQPGIALGITVGCVEHVYEGGGQH